MFKIFIAYYLESPYIYTVIKEEQVNDHCIST